MESNISPAQSSQSISPTDQIDTKYAAILSSSLNKFRNNKKYTDIEIITSTGQVFPAHRVIVATAGQRFGQLLDKAQTKPGCAGVIQLVLPQQVPSDGINRLLEYIYRNYSWFLWNLVYNFAILCSLLGYNLIFRVWKSSQTSQNLSFKEVLI